MATWSGQPGGSGRNLLDLVDALDPRPVVCVPEGPVAAGARERGVPVITLPERSLELRTERLAALRRLTAHAAELRGLIGAFDPDLVVAWGMRTLLAVSLARTGARVLFSHPDLLPAGAPSHVVRLAARRASHVVCASGAIAADLDPGGRICDLRVVPHGVDLDRFRPGLDEREPTALTLGAIVGWKRPDLAVEALARVRQDLPDARLRLVGSAFGADGAALARRLSERAEQPDLVGRVDLVGAVDDPLTEVQRAGCLLHCADREPFGRVVAEALACGTPVVAAAGGGPAEMVDESSGRLYPPGDAAAAARALVDVLGDSERRRALARGARARAESILGVERTYAGLRKAVEAAGRPRAPGRSAGEAVSVVVVTHDSESELRVMLASLERYLGRAQLIVVDSGSSDRSVEVARRAGASVIELGKNVGFGRGINAGLEAVDRPVTIIANPDLELVDESLAQLTRRAQHDGRLLAPLLISPDGSRQDSVHPAPTTGPDLLRALVPPALLPRRLAEPLAPQLSRRPRRVGWAVGACLVARTDTLRYLGGFDSSIFLYGEDLDLGLRASAASVETWFWPDARTLHHEAHSTVQAFGGEAFDLLAEQRQRVIRRRLGPRRARLDGAAQLATFLNRLVIKALAGRPTDRERRQLTAAWRAVRSAGVRG